MILIGEIVIRLNDGSRGLFFVSTSSVGDSFEWDALDWICAKGRDGEM
jgi:hypothetical protein